MNFGIQKHYLKSAYFESVNFLDFPRVHVYFNSDFLDFLRSIGTDFDSVNLIFVRGCYLK